MTNYENKSITIESFCGGYDQNFVYLVTDTFTGQQCLIDAALPLSIISPSVTDTISSILITHSHSDHISYLAEISHKYPSTKIYSFSNFLQENSNLLSARDNQIINFGRTTIKVLHTPGHFPDSVCFLINNSLFTGDTLFVGRTGRTISPGSNIKQLYQSVYSKLLTLPADTLIFPGHNYGSKPTITLEENIKISPLLQAVNEQDFIARMDHYEAHR